MGLIDLGVAAHDSCAGLAPGTADAPHRHAWSSAGADDPGYPIWIQVGKLHEGLFSYRYMLADSDPKSLVEVVTLA